MLHLVVLAIHCVQSHLSTSLVSRSIGYNDARQFVDVERTVSACAVDEMQPGVCDEVKSLNKERCRRVSSQQSFVHAACIVNPVLPIIDTIIFSRHHYIFFIFNHHVNDSCYYINYILLQETAITD